MPKSSSIFCRQIGASRILWAAAIVVSSTAGSVRAEAPEQPAQTFELSPEVEAILKESCLDCHNPNKARSDLSVASVEDLLQGGEESGPAILPGDSGRSPLILYMRGDLQPRMPKGDDPLPEAKISLIARWIDGLKKASGPKKKLTWPWTKLVKPEVPGVKRTEWVRNPVDAFVLAKLEERGLEPAPPTSPRSLLRRLTFGLTGLPPSAELIEKFSGGQPVSSESIDQATADAIETLLADPGYGEHWGRIWLDLVRYSDTRGGAIDYSRPHMWRYRDYVIRAFNQDRPYDRFIREQIAGDSYRGVYGSEGKIALAYLAQWVQVERTEGPQVRRDFLTDVVSTTGSVFLGMTLGCAQCHDHKYDPIPQRDYYRMEAFFAPLTTTVASVPFTQYEMPLVKPEVWERHEKAWGDVLAERGKWQKEVKASYRKRLADRRYLDAPADLKDFTVAVSDADVKAAVREGLLFSKEEQEAYALIERQTARFANPNSPDYYQSKAYVANDSGLKDVVGTYVLSGGSFKLRGEAVEPGFFSAVTGHGDPVDMKGLSGTRRALLADWIASPDNPLTARVMINRIWQHLFGEGLVATPSDLGKNGSGTVHEDLLDWLAVEFIESGWSFKHVQRLILHSSVFRLAMQHPNQDACAEVDPENKYFWARDPVRLTGEQIRDSILFVSGELNRDMGRPPFFPVAADDLLRRARTWWAPSPREERSRRSVYMLQIRSFPMPFMQVFDGRNMDESCPQRNVTTVTPQVFALFNSQFAHEQSRLMAERITQEAGDDREVQIERAFELAFQRSPSPEDKISCLEFLGERRDDLSGASGIVTADASSEPESPARGSLADLCLVLLNTNEFIYLD